MQWNHCNLAALRCLFTNTTIISNESNGHSRAVELPLVNLKIGFTFLSPPHMRRILSVCHT